MLQPSPYFISGGIDVGKVIFKRSMAITCMHMSEELSRGLKEIDCTTVEQLLCAEFKTLIGNKLLLRNWDELIIIILKLDVMYHYLNRMEIGKV